MPAPPLIHPTAVISTEATLAPDVRVGPYCVVDGPVTLGAGCVLRPHAIIVGRVTLGVGNDVGSGCVLGDRPQHLGYRGEDTSVEIGDHNIFREHVTVHRGMPNAKVATRIGSRNFFMASSHIAHDCDVGNDCLFANSAMLAGHVTIGDRVFLSGNSAIHQNVTIGRIALVSGMSGASQDVPPFWMIRGINGVAGINVTGMKRAGVSHSDIHAVRLGFKMIYRDRMTVTAAADRMEEELGSSEAVMEVVRFIRAAKRGIPGAHQYRADSTAAAA